MTLDECQLAISSIRQRQGTDRPILRVDYGGSIFQGRLRRSDSDPEFRDRVRTPFGLLVLEDPGLTPRPDVILQIAHLERNSIKEPAAGRSADSRS